MYHERLKQESEHNAVYRVMCQVRNLVNADVFKRTPTSIYLMIALSQTRLALENCSIQGHYDPSRHRKVVIECFFKKIRPKGSVYEYQDLLCEIVCSRLAAILDLPVPYHVPVNDSRLGVGLVSQFCGPRMYQGEAIVNSSKLSDLFVFEQWVMNTDDKPDHFRVHEIGENNLQAVVVDHGHTLHAWRQDLQDPDAVASNQSLTQPSSSHNVYGVKEFEALRPMLARIREIDDDLIDTTVKDAFDELTTLRLEDASFQSFLQQRDSHVTIITRILKTRRGSLDMIIRKKCQALGIPT